MNSRFIKFLVINFLVVGSFYNLFAVEIFSANEIKKTVETFVDKETLVVFDLDDVIILNPVGCWFYKMVETIQNKGFSLNQAKSKIIPLYDQKQETVKVNLVEQEIKELIENLQNQGINVIILTSRSVALQNKISEQLKDVGIDITKTMLPEKLVNKLDPKLNDIIFYRNGVLICDCYKGYDKGQALKFLIGNNKNFNFKKLVFIDDRQVNVDAIKKAANDLSFQCLAIRYSFTDSIAAKYELDEESLKIAQNFATELKNSTLVG